MGLGEPKNGCAGSGQGFTQPRSCLGCLSDRQAFWSWTWFSRASLITSTPGMRTPAISPDPGNLTAKFVMWETVFFPFPELKHIPASKLPVILSTCLEKNIGKGDLIDWCSLWGIPPISWELHLLVQFEFLFGALFDNPHSWIGSCSTKLVPDYPLHDA